MNASIEAVLGYLDKVDPPAARRARERYACFDCYGGDTQKYRYETALGHGGSCEDAVVSQFVELYGTVTASSDWGCQAERKRVRPALRGSFEALFHETGMKRFLLLLREQGRLKSALREPLLERAIGVIYPPETGRTSHYFHARLSEQFDAVIHFDETRAVEPLERNSTWEIGETPETFPSGI